MPTKHAMSLREHDSRARIRAAANRLAKRLGVEPMAEPGRAKSSELGRLRDLAVTADFLESLDAAAKEKGFSAAPGSEGAFDPPEEAPNAPAAETPADGPQDAPDAAPKPRKGKAS